MGIFTSIGVAVEAIRWLYRQKKEIERDANAYFSDARAEKWRLCAEVLFKTLEDGEANPNFKSLPKAVRWICGPTRVDNYVGRFGQKVLKSGKLERSDPVLRHPIYPVQ